MSKAAWPKSSGPAAGRLHTARSRNDQVAVDFRLWVRDALDAILAQIADAATCARGPRARERGDGHARLHPSAIGAASHLRPSSHGLCRDAGPRRGALQGRAQAPERVPARRGRARRHVVPDRPRHDRSRRSASTGRPPIRSTASPTATSPSRRSPPRRSRRRISRASPRRSCCGRRRNSASSGFPTPSRPARRSCRRSAIPTRRSSCAARPAGSSARWSASWP